MDSLNELKALIASHCGGGACPTAIPRLSLFRYNSTTALAPVYYHPSLWILAQGKKRVLFGQKISEYASARYMVITLDLPLAASISEASPDQPYLALILRFNREAVAGIIANADPGTAGLTPTGPAIRASALTEELLDPVVRLVRLLDNPGDIPALAPLIEREVMYRLLQGEQGAAVRHLALGHSTLSQIGRAIAWIKTNYAQRFSAEAVAEAANMSPASLFRHFREVTGTSPLQYQKRIRLQEARQLLLAEDSVVATIAFQVGYDSPSQFNREYGRLFGVTPARDAARLRKGAAFPAWPGGQF